VSREGVIAVQAQAIEARLIERGESSARAARVATLDTRERKPEAVNWSQLIGEWRERARKGGFGEPEIKQLLNRRQTENLSSQGANQIVEHLTSASGLTKQASSFSRRDVLRGIAEQLQQGGQIALIEALADGVLASTSVVPLRGDAEAGERRLENRQRGWDLAKTRSGERKETYHVYLHYHIAACERITG